MQGKPLKNFRIISNMVRIGEAFSFAGGKWKQRVSREVCGSDGSEGKYLCAVLMYPIDLALGLGRDKIKEWSFFHPEFPLHEKVISYMG